MRREDVKIGQKVIIRRDAYLIQKRMGQIGFIECFNGEDMVNLRIGDELIAVFLREIDLIEEPKSAGGEKTLLPSDPKKRKAVPLAAGVLDYFPAALAEVAKVSYTGNEQHNPGEELHWARGKSQDHADCIMRHLTERGTIDTDGQRHSAKLAWRALALLQLELEAEGAPKARGAK